MAETKPLPEVLYHYTTPEAFRNMVASGVVWATHAKYLNDTTEFRFAFDVVAEELSIQISEQSGSVKTICQQLHARRDSLVDDTGLYVSSFSAEGDLLNQWRSYCSMGRGYALGVRARRSPIFRTHSCTVCSTALLTNDEWRDLSFIDFEMRRVGVRSIAVRRYGWRPRSA
jgi:hypothetical protein